LLEVPMPLRRGPRSSCKRSRCLFEEVPTPLARGPDASSKRYPLFLQKVRCFAPQQLTSFWVRPLTFENRGLIIPNHAEATPES
jgi:hypothetical protein